MSKDAYTEFPKREEGRDDLMQLQFLDEYKGQILQNIWDEYLSNKFSGKFERELIISHSKSRRGIA